MSGQDSVQYMAGTDCSGVAPLNGVWLTVPTAISANETTCGLSVLYH